MGAAQIEDFLGAIEPDLDIRCPPTDILVVETCRETRCACDILETAVTRFAASASDTRLLAVDKLVFDLIGGGPSTGTPLGICDCVFCGSGAIWLPLPSQF